LNGYPWSWFYGFDGLISVVLMGLGVAS
jgi:hypothetical protein